MDRLDFHAAIQHLLDNYGGTQDMPNKGMVTVDLPAGTGVKGFLRDMRKLIKPNVAIEYWAQRQGRQVFWLDMDTDHAIEAKVLAEPRSHSMDGDQLYADMADRSRQAGFAGWFIQPGAHYCWAEFLEGPNKGDILTPSVPPFSHLKPGDVIKVRIMVSNGTVYGKTQLWG